MTTEKSFKCNKCQNVLCCDNFYASKNSRGYQYTCKKCMCEGVKATKTSTEKINNMLMIALKYCPSYDQFIVLAQDIEHIDYDWLFQEIAVKYPDRYADAYRVIQQNQVGKKTKKNKKESNENNEINENDTNDNQDYEQQYKNDDTMEQVGEDIESDDEHTTITVRSENEWTKVRVKRA